MTEMPCNGQNQLTWTEVDSYRLDDRINWLHLLAHSIFHTFIQIFIDSIKPLLNIQALHYSLTTDASTYVNNKNTKL